MAGVLSTRVGYTGGANPAPTYGSVCGGDGHLEAIRVEFDTAVVSYEQLLVNVFFQHPHRRKAKRQYSSAIFVHDDAQRSSAMRALKQAQVGEGVVTIADAPEWHDAEEYHQKYYERAHGGLACSRPR
mmetsp:Transcript_5598/g.14301  ORF Transcript_5598/g.14301 Transcript_5598/m.14301 type:complete len:128 (-) Transcript_5598:321-704(-)